MDQNRNVRVRESLLYADLHTDSRDVLYCAMTYITRRGGPSIIGPSDDLANLQANRGTVVKWLLEQQDQDEIVEDYIEYKKRWSPIFMD